METDPYKLLGVSQNSPLEEIKAAYRELVKQHHPDTGGDQQKIIELNAAWEVLKKEHKNQNLNTLNNSQTYDQSKCKKENTKCAIHVWGSPVAIAANTHLSYSLNNIIDGETKAANISAKVETRR